MEEHQSRGFVIAYSPTMQNTLLIIDPQNDFHAGGSLAVPGADEDALRLAAWIGACPV